MPAPRLPVLVGEGPPTTFQFSIPDECVYVDLLTGVTYGRSYSGWVQSGGGAPSGPAGGDLTGSYPNPVLFPITTAQGPIGDSTHVPVVTVDAKGRVTALSTAAIAGGAPSGPAGGDLAGTYPNPTLNPIGSATGPIGDATHTPTVTIDTKGRTTALTSTLITGVTPGGSATGDLTGTYPAPTLAAIGSATGPIGDATHVAAVTIDAKGRVTALTSVAITGSNPIIPAVQVNGNGAADFTSTSTTFVNISSPALDIVIAAAASDILEYTFTGLVYASAGTPNIQFGLDVGGTQVSIARTQPSGSIFPIGAYIYQHVVQSGQISGGNVTAKPIWKVASGATTAGLENTTANSVPRFTVKNLRH